jgi:branched-chain amino acid transport system substrate-binding protein
MKGLVTTLRSMSKWRLFSLLVIATVALSALTSLVTYVTVLDRSRATPLRIALIAPMSGEDQQIGRSMQAGAAQWTATLARRGGPAGHPVELVVFDEATDPDAARKAAADPSILGVIGPFGQDATARARPILEAASLPALTLGSTTDAPGPRAAMFEMAPRPLQEIRFLANYVRNVLGERLVSIILPADPGSAALADNFDQVLQRFGTRVVYRWPAPTDSPAALDAALKAAATDISDRKVAGTILVLGPQAFAARAIATLRGAEVPNRIIGTSTLATNAFRTSFQAAWAGHGAGDAAMNGTVVTLPVLFDTAGIAAQAFRDSVTAATGTAPDWPAVLAYDAASVLGAALSAETGALNGDPAALRERLRLQIATHNTPDRALGLPDRCSSSRGPAPHYRS